MTFVFEEIAEADAEKLVALLCENVEYRPDYFGTLAAIIMRQWEQQRRKAGNSVTTTMERGMQPVTIAEVYEKYKHLEIFLSEMCPTSERPEDRILSALWQAVKEEAIRKEKENDEAD